MSLFFVEVVSIFALCTALLANVGVFHQALSEGQAAAASVFRVIDEVNEGE